MPKGERKLILVAHNIRSANNVGSLLRTADGLGVDNVYLTGYSPYPAKQNDPRLPHLRLKLERRIHKTALGAEDSVSWEHQENLMSLIPKLKADGFMVLALEQTPRSIELSKFRVKKDVALIVGNERTGVEEEILALCDQGLVIPMAGQKESFNVAVAAAIALYHLKFS